MVVGELEKSRHNRGQAVELYFWGDNIGLAEDLLFEKIVSCKRQK